MKLLYSTLKMEAVCSSKKLVPTQQTTCHNQEAHNVKFQNHENFNLIYEAIPLCNSLHPPGTSPLLCPDTFL
jgi:hypothetical protein